MWGAQGVCCGGGKPMALTCWGRAWSDSQSFPGGGLSQRWTLKGKTWQMVGSAFADVKASIDRGKPQDCLKSDQHGDWWVCKFTQADGHLLCVERQHDTVPYAGIPVVTWWSRHLSKWNGVKVAQSCPTLCDPMDYTVHGILQARILEWVAFPFSRGSSQPRDRTQVSHIAGDSLPAQPQGKQKNAGVGSLSPFQEIFPTQESNRGLLHCRRILYQLSYE